MKPALCVLSTLALLSTAHAEPRDHARAVTAYNEGQARYAAGDFAQAAARFLEAYAHEPDPVYLFDVAQSFRFAHACAQAADYYRRFLAAVTSAPNLDKVRAYLDEVDACAAHERPRPPPPAPPHASGASGASPGLRTTQRVGLAVAAGGLVAIAAGAWFQHDVRDYEQKTRSCSPAQLCTAAQVEHWSARGHTASTAAITSYSIGAAALLGGGVLYLLGRRDHEPPVAVSVGRGGATVAATFAF